MLIQVHPLGEFVQFTTKTGKVSYRAPAWFDDDGAKYPQGRGTAYSTKPVKGVPDVMTGRLISYDRGEARFAV